MVKISEGLIRKRAEHNECIISTLEEVSLHQQDIDKIEYLDKWCRDLKILYLQSNLIPKIENVSKLKKLEYLNLALNNVEKIENLEGCESLKKLDLTVNFVGELTSIECLKDLYNFGELFLTGNPCCDFEGYRDFVIATLPQLRFLDGIEIEKSERIQAIQKLHLLRPSILEQQAKYRKKRQREKETGDSETTKKDGTDWYTNVNEEPENGSSKGENEKTEEEKDKEFWQEKTAFTPESRVKVHEHMQKVKEREERKSRGPDPPKRERRLQTDDGRVLNVNEPKVDFTLKEDFDNQAYVLDVAMFRHMDTSLCDVDVQPDYVRVTLKGKILQLVLQEDVKPDFSSAKRSQTTGHLVITMPKANPEIIPANVIVQKEKNTAQEKRKSNNEGIQRLEVDPSSAKTVDIANIFEEKMKNIPPLLGSQRTPKNIPERANSDDFVDDPDVPPLM